MVVATSKAWEYPNPGGLMARAPAGKSHMEWTETNILSSWLKAISIYLPLHIRAKSRTVTDQHSNAWASKEQKSQRGHQDQPGV